VLVTFYIDISRRGSGWGIWLGGGVRWFGLFVTYDAGMVARGSVDFQTFFFCSAASAGSGSAVSLAPKAPPLSGPTFGLRSQSSSALSLPSLPGLRGQIILAFRFGGTIASRG